MSYTVSPKERVIRLNVTDRIEAALQGVALVLGTHQGTVPQFRDFGIPWGFHDRPIQIGKAIMFAKVREAIMEYVPEAELLAMDFVDDPDDPAHTYPVAEVEIT